jgi:CheY-like chemotaxis protein
MSRTLLVADDSVTIQKVVELTFSDSGHRVVGVGDGKAALETARELRPDLVLCDVIMPEMNGYEVCEQLKAEPLTAGTPVLLLTGAFEPFDEERARACGADGHLTKPFESRVLLDRVEELLQGAGASPEPPAAAPAEVEATPSFDLEAEATPEQTDSLAETAAGAPEPLAWDAPPEPEEIPHEPAPPPVADGGEPFVPDPEPPPNSSEPFRVDEDWLSPEPEAPPAASFTDDPFTPEEAGELASAVSPPSAASLDENPIVLDELAPEAPAEAVFRPEPPPAPPGPASDSPAPLDLAQALADPSLRGMVEAAVERVVREVVREVAWEIVPDLTEGMLSRAARGEDDSGR